MDSDHFLSAGIVICIFALGVICLFWPQRMLWPRRSVLAAGLSAQTRTLITRVGGLVILLFSMFLTWGIIKGLY